MFSPIASIDGFGDRDDIALEKSKSEDQRRENQDNDRFEIDLEIDAAREWGTASNARHLSEIVEEMLDRGVHDKLLLKSEVIRDMTLTEAVTEACIRLGLSDEAYSPTQQDKGNQLDIRLF